MSFLHDPSDIGPHPLPQLHIFFADGVDLFPVAPHLILRAGTAGRASLGTLLGLSGFPVSMKPHDRAKGAPLKPSGK